MPIKVYPSRQAYLAQYRQYLVTKEEAAQKVGVPVIKPSFQKMRLPPYRPALLAKELFAFREEAA